MYNKGAAEGPSRHGRCLAHDVMILQVTAVLHRPAETAIRLSRSGSLAGIHRHSKKADVIYLQEGRVLPTVLTFLSFGIHYIRLLIKLYILKTTEIYKSAQGNYI